MFKIRELLDILAALDIKAVRRLRDLRELGGRSPEEMCETLARSYRGDEEAFVAELRKQDLALLLRCWVRIERFKTRLAGADAYAVDDLRRIAHEFWFTDGLREELTVELLDEDVDGEEEDDDDESVIDDEDDLLDIRKSGPTSADYAQQFWGELRPEPGRPRERREYQETAIVKVLAALRPDRPALLQLPTGGGKTYVANRIVTSFLRTEQRLLWVTKDWPLLHQAAGDLARGWGFAHDLGRIGGDGKALHPLPEGKGKFLYTTLHTLHRRGVESVLRRLKPSLIVWDEAHWGEDGRFGRVRTAARAAGVPLLGLTATPRTSTDAHYDVAYSITFAELVQQGYLAEPNVIAPICTGTQWRPRRSSEFSDFTAASLAELAADSRRNRLIVDTYVARAREFGKTIVFACGVEHTDELAERFCKAGIAARPIHSFQDDQRNRAALEAFRAGSVQVLVNMAMLTHGVDVPDARSVFLCRPTASDILFAQMIGRAARPHKASGKRSFHVVEFTDNVDHHGEQLWNAKRYFSAAGGGARSASRPLAPTPRAARDLHRFDSSGAPTWIPDDPTLTEAVRGLWFREGQTFGIEFELTSREAVPRSAETTGWSRIASPLLEAIRASGAPTAPAPIHGYAGQGGEKDSSVWNVEYDSSVGWEVTSPVLVGLTGFLQVSEVARHLDGAVRELGLALTHRTGTHVHLGWQGRSIHEILRAIRLAKVFEPALASLVAPSRVVAYDGGDYDLSNPNRYCRPLASALSRQRLAEVKTYADLQRGLADEESRYLTLNVKSLESIGTVEARMHSGTIDAPKILLWISLWQQILWAASERPAAPDVPDVHVLRPDADIVALAHEWLPPASQREQRAFLERLSRRRSEVVQLWRSAPGLEAWLAYARRWRDPT